MSVLPWTRCESVPYDFSIEIQKLPWNLYKENFKYFGVVEMLLKNIQSGTLSSFYYLYPVKSFV